MAFAWTVRCAIVGAIAIVVLPGADPVALGVALVALVAAGLAVDRRRASR